MEYSQKSLNKKQPLLQIKLSICLKANVHKKREYIRKDLLISIRKVQSPIKFQNGSNHFQLKDSFPYMSYVFVVFLFFILKNHHSLKIDGTYKFKWEERFLQGEIVTLTKKSKEIALSKLGNSINSRAEDPCR